MTNVVNEAEIAISNYQSNRLIMEDMERSQLWQQRLAEAVFGMTVYLIEKRDLTNIFGWIQTQSEIFSNLPDHQSEDYHSWQRVFFRAQALCEKFLVSRYGHDEMSEWVRANAWVHKSMERSRGGGAADVANRIARQAELYSSVYTIRQANYAQAEVVISHCAIWDYRERARERGVPITLESPCEYCTKAISSNIAAKGHKPEFDLFDNGASHGCRWRITRLM